MTDAIRRMVAEVRREMIAFCLAGVALHWIIKQGFTRWSMAALGVSLGIGASTRRKKKAPPTE